MNEKQRNAVHEGGLGNEPWPIVLNILDLRYLLANQVKILSKRLIFKYEAEEETSAEEIKKDAILKSIELTYFPPSHPDTEVILV